MSTRASAITPPCCITQHFRVAPCNLVALRNSRRSPWPARLDRLPCRGVRTGVIGRRDRRLPRPVGRDPVDVAHPGDALKLQSSRQVVIALQRSERPQPDPGMVGGVRAEDQAKRRQQVLAFLRDQRQAVIGDATADENGPDAGPRASGEAVPCEALAGGIGQRDAERVLAVIVDGAEGTVAFPVASGFRAGQARLDVPFKALAGRKVARHPGNPLMARGVPAGSTGIMSTLLERGVGRAGVLLDGWAPVLSFSRGMAARYPSGLRLPFLAGGIPASRASWRR